MFLWPLIGSLTHISWIWVKLWRHLVGNVGDLHVLIFSVNVLSLYVTPSFSPLRFFSFLAAGGEDASKREGGRWNRDSRYQSTVTCIVDTHVTQSRYTQQYHHLPSPLHAGKAPRTFPRFKPGPVSGVMWLCLALNIESWTEYKPKHPTHILDTKGVFRFQKNWFHLTKNVGGWVGWEKKSEIFYKMILKLAWNGLGGPSLVAFIQSKLEEQLALAALWHSHHAWHSSLKIFWLKGTLWTGVPNFGCHLGIKAFLWCWIPGVTTLYIGKILWDANWNDTNTASEWSWHLVALSISII